MSLVKVLVATFIMILGQIGSFMQLQGAIKYGWYEKYMWVILLSSIPVSYLYIVAVRMYVDGFNGQRNTIQLRFDILNFGNMVNDKWGVSQRATNPTILTYNSVVNNEPVYRLATQKFADGTTGLLRDTYSRNSSVFDVWTAQFGIRYIFGR